MSFTYSMLINTNCYVTIFMGITHLLNADFISLLRELVDKNPSSHTCLLLGDAYMSIQEVRIFQMLEELRTTHWAKRKYLAPVVQRLDSGTH